MIDNTVSLEALNKSNLGNLSEALGIEYTEINPDFLKARMPVNQKTIQQLGMLSGGASAALAETTGSIAAYLSLDRKNYYCVGLELKINHIKSAFEGYVYSTATPVHTGKTTHVWQIRIADETGDLISLATLTLVILPLDEMAKKCLVMSFFNCCFLDGNKYI